MTDAGGSVTVQHNKPRWVVWAIVGLIGFVGLVLAGGALGLIENASGVLMQVVASAGIVLAAAVPLLRRAEQNARSAAASASVTREQTQNSHKTNLREELDERHEELVQLFKNQNGQIEHIVETQRQQSDDIRGIKSDQRGIRRDIGRHSDMIVTVGEKVAAHTERLHRIDLLNETLPRAAIMKLLAENPAADAKEATSND